MMYPLIFAVWLGVVVIVICFMQGAKPDCQETVNDAEDQSDNAQR